uniref:O-antigen/teichoic acid export membrane protein n=2 Tax=Rhodocyclus tenuis TaxID=1066 RepID=A0A840GG59_RHOTE|nr:O-antigen/teichoic acid export membrane protein [Rhodocyclus tenuis]
MGTQIVLARILGPEQYGLFAIAAVVIGFSGFFSDVGIAYGLIQKQDVSAHDLRFVFTWQLIIGTLVSAAIVLLSGPIAAFFGEAKAQEIVSVLAVVCLLNALMAPAQNMLKRELNIRRIQLANIAGYVGGYVAVGVPLALSGAAVWALVASWIVQVSITLLILYAGVRHPLQPLFWFVGGGQLMRYGGTVLITNITNWVIGNIERVVIGRYFASREIGLYATSYNLINGPVSSLLGVVQPVFFSAASRIADQRERLVEVYLGIVALTALVVLPLFASVSAVADTLVLALYGAKWVEAGVLLSPLSLAIPLLLFWGLTTPLLWIGGAPEREFRVQLPMALLWVAISWAAAQHSLEAVAWSVVLLFALRFALIFFAARQLLPISFAGLWRACRGGLLLAMICASIAAASDGWLRAEGLPAFVRLLIDAALAAAVYLLLLMKLPGIIPGHCGELLTRLAARCPAPLGCWLGRLPVMG